MRTKKLKEQKRFPWSASAFGEAARQTEPRPPRIHLIILQAPLGTSAVIKQVAGLSEMPAVEQTKTIPEEGEGEETVSFCRLSDNPYCEVSEWITGGDFFCSLYTSCLRASAKRRGKLSLWGMKSLATRLSAVKTVIDFVRSTNKFNVMRDDDVQEIKVEEQQR